MKVLGCDMGVIRNMFLIESGFIGFMGGIIDVAFSYGVSFLVNRFLQIGQMMTGQAGDISISGLKVRAANDLLFWWEWQIFLSSAVSFYEAKSACGNPQ